ncbi:MAG: RNA polymerase sigma factor [Phycisphaerae bacterium]|jgi:RNA polymerase sigma-70 factor (ECF subfamily)|nr:RNA polymerase sigma factor [Phycisphaerae bacterium]
MESKPQATDEALMARFTVELDSQAFDLIVARYIHPGLAVARQYLQDSSLAEDAVQTAMLRVIKQRHKYQPFRPFANWFYTILRNTCRDMLRHQSHQARLIRDVATTQAYRTHYGPSGELETRDLLGTLPKTSRAVLELRILHGLAFRDIAAALGISHEAAKKRAQRGLRLLREGHSHRTDLENGKNLGTDVPRRVSET